MSIKTKLSPIVKIFIVINDCMSADQRTNDWFLIRSPIPGLTILGLYLYFTLKWGPRYMADKKPFQLQKTLVVYNFLQVLISIWVFYEVHLSFILPIRQILYDVKECGAEEFYFCKHTD